MTEHEEATPMTDAPAPVEDPTVDQPSAAQDEPAKPESAEALEASAAGTAVEAPVEGAVEAPVDEPAAEATPVAPAPRPVVPSPAMFARTHAAPTTSEFGRVGEDGVVYVITPEGEREVGSYPGVSHGEALAYFVRKYDDVAALVTLLHQRVTQTDVPAKEASDSLAKLREQVTQARVVGDLAALDQRLADIEAGIATRRAAESAARAEAKAAATTAREEIVAEAEQIAGQPEARIQWKTSGARMRELLDVWKTMQRSGPRLDKDVEAAMWTRFSAARNGFDKARRSHFAHLDSTQAQARAAKERLVADAERLATSHDWAVTAGAFKRLMDEWRQAGRASRADDDALWTRFKAAQDAFFAAKDAVVAAEDEEYRANLTVKECLLKEADAILPVKDLEAAKSALRVIQDKWDRAGKVPRADLERTEKALRRVEQAVRDAEDKRWAASNPEAAARAQSLVDQLEKAVADLQTALDKAQASGNAKKVSEAAAALEARQQWLAQARAGLQEFGPRG